MNLYLSAKAKNMKDYFKSPSGRDQIIKLYEERLKPFSGQYESIYIPNSFGETHVLKVGSSKLPALFLMHGSNANAAIALDTFPNLSKEFCLYIPDLPAQPNKSVGNRPNMKNDDFAIWAAELADVLNVTSFYLAGFSLGGLVALKILEYRSDMVKECFLASPAYIVNAFPLQPLMKLFIPLKRYIKKLESRPLEKVVQNLFSEPDDFAYRFLASVFQHFELDFSPIPTISFSAARRISTPLHIIAAENDLIFPASKMEKRAKMIFKNLRDFKIASQSKHVIGRRLTADFESYIIKTVQAKSI
jgi:pimeloyl-ACP methyl ester carboxylesterase